MTPAPISKIQSHESHGDSWHSRIFGYGSSGTEGILRPFFLDPHLTPDLNHLLELDLAPELHPSHSFLTPTFSLLSFVISFSFILTLKCTPFLSWEKQLPRTEVRGSERVNSAFYLISKIIIVTLKEQWFLF